MQLLDRACVKSSYERQGTRRKCLLLSLCLFRAWKDAELFEQSPRIPIDPIVSQLAVPDLGNRAAADRGASMRRRNPHEVATVRSRGSILGHDEIAAGEHLVDLEVKIGERVNVRLHELAARLTARHRRGDGI